MGPHLSSRRLVRSAVSLTNTSSPSPLNFHIPSIPRRTIFGWGTKKNSTLPENPLTEEFLRRKPAINRQVARGDLASSSIFEDEEAAGPKPAPEAAKKQRAPVRDPSIMAAALDPDPSNRERWERKMVIREIHKRGRLSRTQQLKQQERELLSKSHNMKTSVKKLMQLARQVAGKSVEEAIVQMRFSKRKAAREVKQHLEHARNEAIVKRGMALGSVNGEAMAPVKIQTKDGKRTKVADPTALYVDQAWVGRGQYGRSPDHRARGQIYMMKNPTTSISLILKEEATRLRQHREREENIKNRKLWVQLPNRPVTAQRQYYSW